jgi:hypothetical protein
LAIFLHKPPAVIILLDKLVKLILLQRYFACLALECELCAVLLDVRLFGRWRWCCSPVWRRRRCTRCTTSRDWSCLSRCSCRRSGCAAARQRLGNRFRSCGGFVSLNKSVKNYWHSCHYSTHPRRTTSLQKLSLSDWAGNASLWFGHWTRATGCRFTRGNVNGVTLIDIVSRNGFILHESNLCCLTFLLGVLDSGGWMESASKVLHN